MNAAKAEYERIKNSTDPDDNEVNAAYQKYSEASSAYYEYEKNNYYKDGKEYKRKVREYEEQIDNLYSQISDIKDKLNVIGMPEVDDILDYTVDYDLASAQKDYDEASAKLTELETKYTDAKTKYESLIKQSTAEDTVNEYSLILETYKNEESSLKDTIKQKNKELEKAAFRLHNRPHTRGSCG